MRDPLSWSLPLFPLFGVRVKLHVLYPVVVLGFFLRQFLDKANVYTPLDIFLFLVPLPFVVILMHEFGHVFGGRSVGGEAEEILMWPLGGLAFVDVPREWRAHTVTAASGPLVNAGLCVVAAAVLLAGGFVPTLNPFDNPYLTPMKGLRDGRTYTSEYGLKLYEPGAKEPTRETAEPNLGGKPPDLEAVAARSGLERAVAPGWAVWVDRAFWLNLALTLLNLIPAFPLDGGQMLQGLVWRRTDYRRGLTVACISGYACGVVGLIVSIWVNEATVVMLSFFILLSCWLKLNRLNAAEGEFGDFSGGYSTLDPDDAPPKRRPQGFFTRWLRARQAKRLQEESQQRQKDDERMDQLLDKIARKEPLTAEERKFMQRVSERYKK